MSNLVGKLQVTVTYTLTVHDLIHYEAETLAEAASNQEAWYRDGSSSFAEDLSQISPDSFTIVAVS